MFTEVSPRITHVPIISMTTKVKEIAIITSTEAIERTTELFEHTNEMIINTESTPMMEEKNRTSEDYSSSTFASIQSTMINLEEGNSTESLLDYLTTNQANDDEQMNVTIVSTDVNEEESSTVSIVSNQTRLFHLLASSVERNTTEYPIYETVNQTIVENITTPMTSLNPCTLENLRANLVYHEYPLDNHKFIFCDSEGKMNVIACSPNYIWSQHEQSCILPS